MQRGGAEVGGSEGGGTERGVVPREDTRGEGSAGKSWGTQAALNKCPFSSPKEGPEGREKKLTERKRNGEKEARGDKMQC